MKPAIAIALSGGVDSLVAAYLLKERGHPVFGMHFVTGYEIAASDHPIDLPISSHRIFDIGKQLGIPVELFDCRTEFQGKVVDYFVQTYLAGQTPNPCLVCNPAIKFGTVLAHAGKLGAEYLATGHYARTKRDAHGHYHLYKGRDQKKDQSYFLARLTQQQLAKARFPLEDMTKSEVKKTAEQKGLHPVTQKESQDICFIKGTSYGEFIAKHGGFSAEPGLIEDVGGSILGDHKGLHLFTIGQRRGINIPAAEPYYVVRLDRSRNRLIVGSKTDLLQSQCKVVQINWINEPPRAALNVHTRVRYRSREVSSTIVPVDPQMAIVRFETPQAALTPGQAAVFYNDDEILGGGWISA
ncbi:MAG: tRNA 2-thiouridine(34) synthase MnmA [Desulfobacterales bacterium]|nr:MAG: tRNA 2-thiouridine(34) synthase MnmA [Desulfobacterales bacterium]